jgi:hypothetical protein
MMNAAGVIKAFNNAANGGFNSSPARFKIADWPMIPAASHNTIQAAWRLWVRNLPKRLHIRKVVTNAAGQRHKRSLPRWIANAFDCDNHAAEFATWLARRNATKAAGGHSVNAAMAKGVVWYNATHKPEHQVSGRHAINWYFIEDDSTLHFFEPATGNLVFLTPEELLSIDHVSSN